MTGEFLSPPPDWPALSWLTPVMTNYDYTIDEGIAERLRRGGLCASHHGRDFTSLVWFAADRWHERVKVHGVVRGSYSADTLQELMKIVNDEHGWA